MSNIPGYGRDGEILHRDEEGRVLDSMGRMVTKWGDRFFPPNYEWQPRPLENIPAHSRDILPELWEKAGVIWESLVLAFGSPIDFIRWIFVRASTHRAIGNWVRHLEELVRRTILIDALTREPPKLSPAKPRQRPMRDRAEANPIPRFRSTSRFDPTTWRVSFAMQRPAYDPAASREQRQKRRRRPRTKFNPRALRRVKPYAYRIEALRRTILYREAHVLRYARRLARLAEANRGRNSPRELSIPDFDYRPQRRTIGMHAVIPYLPRANVIAMREAILWNAKFAEPG